MNWSHPKLNSLLNRIDHPHERKNNNDMDVVTEARVIDKDFKAV